MGGSKKVSSTIPFLRTALGHAKEHLMNHLGGFEARYWRVATERRPREMPQVFVDDSPHLSRRLLITFEGRIEDLG